jgi:threonine dehydratase
MANKSHMTDYPSHLPDKAQLIEAQEQLATWVHQTPVLTSSYINELVGAQVFFKCEQLQRMGAFKMRGATKALLDLSPEQRAQGVVTHSSGNFGQAVALASKMMGVTAYVVMPDQTPQVKKAAVRGYGAQVTECVSTIEARVAMTAQIVSEKGATPLHPSNDLSVILGNATAAMEFLNQVSGLDQIVVPVGGGGLLAGTALACHYFGQECLCIGAEPEQVNDAFRSLQTGVIQHNAQTNTIADGLKTQLGDVNFPIIESLVSAIHCVDEQEIVGAMRLLYERMKLVVEPSSAVALAAVLKNHNLLKGKNIGIILSGGNVDLSALPF